MIRFVYMSYARRGHSLSFYLFLVVIFLGNVFAQPVWAAGLSQTAQCSGVDCQACNVVLLVNGVVEWLVLILGTIAAIIIVYAGFKLVTSGGNQHAMQDAKEMISNMIIGYVIVLAGWLLIDTGMKMLLADGETALGFWNEIKCVDQPEVKGDPWENPDEAYVPISGVLGGLQGWVPAGAMIGGNGVVVGGAPGSYNAACTLLPGPPGVRTYNCATQQAQCRSAGGAPSLNAEGSIVTCTPSAVSGGGGGGSGTCTVVANVSNACHPSKLTCFPDRNLASEICNLESRGGNTSIMSGTDLCQDGRSFSVGLWQINILANRALIPGCTGNFFTSDNNGRSEGSCIKYTTNSRGTRYCQFRSCRITNINMYNQCVSQAKIPINNTRAACSLMRSQGWSAWQTSYNECR